MHRNFGLRLEPIPLRGTSAREAWDYENGAPEISLVDEKGTIDEITNQVKDVAGNGAEYMGPSFLLGGNTYFCAGADEFGAKHVFRETSDGNELLAFVGVHDAHILDISQGPKDTVAFWYTGDGSTVILDGITGDIFQIEGIVQICEFSRNLENERERIIILKQLGLYNSKIPASVEQVSYGWKTSGKMEIILIPDDSKLDVSEIPVSKLNPKTLYHEAPPY